jgi:PAS domain S-box-containing protein
VDDSAGEAAAEQRASVRRSESAEDLFENAPCGYLSAYADGRLARVNRTFLTWTGYDRDELVEQRRFIDLLAPGSRIYHETHVGPLLRMQGAVRAIAMDLVRADGSRLPVLVNSHQITEEDGTVIGVRTSVFDASDRREYERELLAARRRAEQAAAWVTAVEQVVAGLAAASTVGDVCGVVAAAGPELFSSTASAVWLRQPGVDGWQWAGAGTGTAAGATPAAASDELPGTAALLKGAVVRGDGAADEDAVRRRLGRPEGVLLLAPLVAAEQTIGVLAVVVPEAGAADLEESDGLRLLSTLGRQAGQALDRARLSDQQQRVATTLQQSMLPAHLPEDPRLGLSACYRPADDGLQVGGDWYDAFTLDHDRIALVVGDVVGRGLHAAAAMGQLRSAVRALAAVDAGPAQLLTRLDAFVEGVPAAQTATLAYAEVDLRDGSVVYACAGHPPPVMVDAAGTTTQLWDGRSTPLGAHFGSRARSEAATVLHPGSRLALYTDGLVELRDTPLDESIDGLARVLAEWAGRPLLGMAEAVADAVLGPGPTGDDVCLLTVAYEDRPTFTHTVPAHLDQVSVVRSALDGWLTAQGVTGDDHHAAVLACSEVVANAVEHGCAGDPDCSVDVLATVGPDGLVLQVRDRGRWRPVGPPGDRGRGLRIVRTLMDHVGVEKGLGTVVTMMRRTRTAGTS